MTDQILRTPVVDGACVTCNMKLELPLGDSIDSARWLLAKSVFCPHCKFDLTAAIRDQSGRFWGRRKVFNE